MRFFALLVWVYKIRYKVRYRFQWYLAESGDQMRFIKLQKLKYLRQEFILQSICFFFDNLWITFSELVI